MYTSNLNHLACHAVDITVSCSIAAPVAWIVKNTVLFSGLPTTGLVLMHTASESKQSGGKAWELGYIVVCSTIYATGAVISTVDYLGSLFTSSIDC